MLPDEIYEVVIQNVGKSHATYQETKEKVVSMVASRIARDEFRTMEVGVATTGHQHTYNHAWETQLLQPSQNNFEVDAVGRQVRCYTCNAFGHIAANCPHGKGGLKGGQAGKGSQGKATWSTQMLSPKRCRQRRSRQRPTSKRSWQRIPRGLLAVWQSWA